MASVFGHIIAGLGICYVQPTIKRNWLIIRSAIYCALAPDLDVLAFKFGISYESIWGHRGVSHSFVSSLFIGLCGVLVVRFFGPMTRSSFARTWLLMSLCALSHMFLDALTNGGHGIAFFAPFDNRRYFLPWRPIEVSDIGGAFFGLRMISVLENEFIYIGLPVLIFSGLVFAGRYFKMRLRSKT